MNRFKLSLFFVSLFFLNLNGQVRTDISLKYEWAGSNIPMLEFRLPVAQKWMYSVGAGFESRSIRGGSGPWWSQVTNVIDASDTLVEFRPRSTDILGLDLRTGISRQLKWPVFSVRADLIGGYRNEETIIISQYMEKSGGQWSMGVPEIDDPWKFAWRELHWMHVGGMVSMQLDLPLGKRFAINGYVGCAMSAALLVQSDVVLDPLGEFSDPVWPSSNLDFTTRFGLGIRCKLGKGKEFPMKNNS